MNTDNLARAPREQAQERAPLSRTTERKVGSNIIQMQQHEQARNRDTAGTVGRKVNQTISQKSHLPTQLTIQDFAGVYPARKIAKDEAYVASRDTSTRSQKHNALVADGLDQEEIDAKFERDANSLPKVFEHFFVTGLQQGRWLGNTSEAQGEDSFTTHTHEATRYDDLRHRIDTFTTLHFDSPVETFAGNISKLPLGFDVTLQTSRDKIVDKLTRCSNASTPLPFGFSELDYYSDGEQKSSFNLLPRYVIGISGDEVKNLREEVRTDPNTGATIVNSLTPRSLMTRFKVLTEIRTQNELFQMMLPEGADESDDVQLRQASAYIEAADERLRHALRVCSDEIVKRNFLPRSVREEIAKRPAAASPQPVIEKYLLETAHRNFVEHAQGYARHSGTIFEDNGENDDTFALIVNCARQLRDAVMDDEDDGPYISQGEVKAHNVSFDIPEE